MAVPNSEQGMVLVMGITGSGKTHFVNQLKHGAVLEGNTLESCEHFNCQIVETRIGETNVAVVDCPGFDDSNKSDAEILSLISELVSTQYHIWMKLWGVIFLHRITDIRFQGSAKSVLSIFRQLVGDEALSNVVLATTQWSKVKEADKPAAIAREQQLRDQYWRDMLDKNSMTTRFEGTMDSAEGIIAQLISKNQVVLQLQKELVDQKKALGKTGAGSLLKPEVNRKLKATKQEIKRLKAELDGGVNNTRKLRIQREIWEAEEQIARGEGDEARLGKKVGVDLIERLKQVNWERGLRLAISALSFAVAIVSLVLGGVP